MHSSTSSFRPLPRVWWSLITGLLLALLWLGGWELFWRHRGFQPSLVNSPALWCEVRDSVSTQSVVILGSSRLQTGVDPQVLAKALGRPVANLAIDGANASVMLVALGEDASFAGTVVLEYMPRRFFTADSMSVSRSDTFLAACRNPSLVAPIESRVSAWLQERFVTPGSELEAMTLLSYVQRHHAPPDGNHEIVRRDRFEMLHFDATVDRSEYWEPELTGAALAGRFDAMRAAVDKIEARGGEVLLYRAPVSSSVLRDEEAHYPAATYLPRAASLLGVRAIDFADLPDVATLQLPDGEHPDHEQVPAMTRALAAAITAVRQQP